MRFSSIVRSLLAVAVLTAVGCSAKLDSASQARVDSLTTSTEAAAARANASATKAEEAARSAAASADRAAAASQKAEAILFRSMKK